MADVDIVFKGFIEILEKQFPQQWEEYLSEYVREHAHEVE